MAAHRIIRVTNSNHVLPRCKSEGTLIDLSEGVTSASLSDVKGQPRFGFIFCHISCKPCFFLLCLFTWLHFIAALFTCSIYANELN